MSKKLPIDEYEWVENTPQLKKDFIENYSEDNDEGYFVATFNNKKRIYHAQKKYKTSIKSWISNEKNS